MDPTLMRFADFLAAQLRQMQPPEYNWGPRPLAVQVAWVPEHLRAGAKFERTDELLRLANEMICQAMSDGDDRALLDAVSVVMDWGGVWNENSAKPIRKLVEAKTLCATLTNNLRALGTGDWPRMTLMNSGWSKVYAVLNPNRYVMYDSRVARFLARQVVAWEAASLDPQQEVRQMLRQTVSSRTQKPMKGYPKVEYSQKSAWAQSMVNASDVLRMIVAGVAQRPEFRNTWLANLTLRELEARVFMLGA